MKTEGIIRGSEQGRNIMGYGLIIVKKNKPELLDMGVRKLNKFEEQYMRIKSIFERVVSIIDQYLPDELAIEAPFFGKNVQSMLKLGRAQGVAMAASLSRQVPITEYAPLKIKMSITGSGSASKEQVASMLQKILKIPNDNMLPQLDATDGLAAALCHYYQSSRPVQEKNYSSWKDFISKNPDKIR